MRRRRRSRRRWVVGAVLLVAVVGTFAALLAVRAGRHAVAAKAALLRAEQQLSARNLDPARTELAQARASLDLMDRELDRGRPLLAVAKVVPVVRSQVIAVETFQRAGLTLTDAGLRLADATQETLASTQGDTPVASALESMRKINGSLAVGSTSVQAALGMVDDLEGRWLIGPVADARDDLLERLPRYARQVRSTAEGLDALIRFAGGEGPRRYLFLSQNPDEIRPTGGFFGTYGVMTASGSSLSFDEFAPIATFRIKHPDAVIPVAEAGSPFRHFATPVPKSLGNVNNTADFVDAARSAMRLWNGSGEEQVDGVVSFMPGFLARILAVTGPVRVEDYGETVDAGNLIERFTFYTARLEEDPSADNARKGFIGSLAQVVLGELLETPSSQWLALAGAVGDGFNAREAMAWTGDDAVARVLAERRWDGTLPTTRGDFFYGGEFSYASKVGRAVTRQYDHHVQLREDGSARITTTMVMRNNRPPGDFLNPGQLTFLTAYGPTGAVLAAESDPPVSEEPAVAGHPAAGWFINAAPLSQTRWRVVWEVDDLVREGPDGTRVYDLWFMGVPDHTGDVLNLRVDLPQGWRWSAEPPPSSVSLDDDLRGSWSFRRG
ncbi:MAG: DUF4012 domain-containing protein [Acidimicrobiia bacterium]